MGIGTMTRGEKAVIFVTSQYLTPSPLITVEDGIEEVHFEVELVHFIQVSEVIVELDSCSISLFGGVFMTLIYVVPFCHQPPLEKKIIFLSFAKLVYFQTFSH